MSENTKIPDEQTPEQAPEQAEPRAEKKKAEPKKTGSKAALSERIAELEAALEKAELAAGEREDKFLRLAAEYDNFRRRSLREKDDVRVTAKTDVVEKLLPVIDNFERAAMNGSAGFEDYRKGIEMTFRQFLEILLSMGVESFGEQGDVFDPNIHNAVMHVEDDSLGESVVTQVFTKGYKLGGSVIRPAAVKVAN